MADQEIIYRIKTTYTDGRHYMYSNGRGFPKIGTARGIASGIINNARSWNGGIKEVEVIPYILVRANDNNVKSLPEGKYLYEK